MTTELNPRKFGSNNEYHLNQPLPPGVAAEILEHTRAFIEFLQSTKTTTHPTVRALVHSAELQIAGLVGLVEAEKIRERIANGEKFEDEGDVISGMLGEGLYHPPAFQCDRGMGGGLAPGQVCRCTCLHTVHPVKNHGVTCPEYVSVRDYLEVL